MHSTRCEEARKRRRREHSALVSDGEKMNHPSAFPASRTYSQPCVRVWLGCGVGLAAAAGARPPRSLARTYIQTGSGAPSSSTPARTLRSTLTLHARGRRPSRSPRHHLRDECRELSSQGRPPATNRGWKDTEIRDNQIHRENVDQRQSERRIALASDNLTRHDQHAATICSHPDSR